MIRKIPTLRNERQTAGIGGDRDEVVEADELSFDISARRREEVVVEGHPHGEDERKGEDDADEDQVGGAEEQAQRVLAEDAAPAPGRTRVLRVRPGRSRLRLCR